MRIPTFNLFAAQLASVEQQYNSLNSLYQQADTNQKLLAPSDDPVLASRINMTSNFIDNLASYQQSQAVAQNRMKMFGTSAANSVNYLDQVTALIQEAQNGTNTDAERTAIGSQLNGFLNLLMTSASAQDGSGGYIYSGSHTNMPPYLLQNGVYQYQGGYDTTTINIGPNASTIYNDVGDNVFGNIPLGNGSFTISADVSNTGTAFTSAGNVVSSSPYVPDTYTIDFVTNAAGNLAYTVTGAASGQVIPPPGDDAPDYIAGPSGTNITFNGMSITFSGMPEVGDSFQTAPSTNDNVFNSLQNLITALQTPTDGNAAKLAQLQQFMSQSAATFATASTSMISYQSEVGTRSAAVNSEVDINNSMISSESEILIQLSIANPFEVLSQLTQQETYLKASLGAYKQIQDVLMSIMKM